MRKIDNNVQNAFWADSKYSWGNTIVYNNAGETVVQLYTTEIAKKPMWDKKTLAIHYGTHPTNTTLARINWIISNLGYKINKKGGQVILTDTETEQKRIINPNTWHTIYTF